MKAMFDNHPDMPEEMLEFVKGIYLEHLEEASFLYEQRLGLFDDPEITWLDIDNFEQRFEPHIDGLVVGEDLALDVCKQQVVEGDFGELHAAVRVFCRQNQKDLVLQVLKTLDPQDKGKITAFTDALKYEMPEEWQNEFIQMLTEGDEKVLTIVATIAGYRRWNAGRQLIQAIEKSSVEFLSKMIWALGRIREKDARYFLLNNLLKHEDEAVRSASAFALLRIGEQAVLDDCVRDIQSDWAIIPLALGGGRPVVSALLQFASAGDASKDCLNALGLLGDIATVEILLPKLANDNLASSAATALNLITGAEIYEEVFIPEEITEDELFEEELEKFKQGKVPKRPDGKPFGTTINRLSQKSENWLKWWKENKSRFDPDVRYRNGKPYSPECLLENLEFPRSPHRVRKLAYEELVIRYGMELPFEADMFVVQQKQALAAIAQWIKANSKRFQAGKWYFAGQLIS
jgi:uncharacterized protein (TIGR02270 family)